MNWLTFLDLGTSASGRTKRWLVRTRDGTSLGHVSWYAYWRKYTFHPAPETVYEQDCLREIATFCEARTAAHKRKAA